MSLSSLIVQREVATIRQVEEALARQVLYGGDLVTNLLEVAQLPETVLVPLLAETVGLSAAPLGPLPAPSPHAKALVPVDLAVRRALFPLDLRGDTLIVAVAEPLDRDVIDELSFALGVTIEQRVAPLVRIREALAGVYGSALDRRMQRLVSRLAGVDVVGTGSLPPLLQTDPTKPGSGRPPPVVIPGAPRAPSPRATPAFGSLAPGGLGPRRRTNSAFPAPDASLIPPRPLPPAAAEPAQRQAQGEAPPDTDKTQPNAVPPVREATPAPAPTAAAQPEPAAPPAAAARPATPPPAPAPPPGASTSRASSAPKPVSAPPGRASSLVRLVQQAQAPARSGRRRRGPITVERAKVELEQATDRDALLDIFFDFALQFFEYSALFIVHGDLAEGRDAYGPGATRHKVLGIGVPLDLPSALSAARDRSAPVIARPAKEGLDAVLAQDLSRNAEWPVLVVPVVVRGRTVALLYGDNGETGVDGAGSSDVTAFAARVGQAFERIIVRRKLGGFSADRAAPASRVDPRRVAAKGRRREDPHARAAAAGALEKALSPEGLVRPSSRPPPAAPPEAEARASAEAGAQEHAQAQAEATPARVPDRTITQRLPRPAEFMEGVAPTAPHGAGAVAPHGAGAVAPHGATAAFSPGAGPAEAPAGAPAASASAHGEEPFRLSVNEPAAPAVLDEGDFLPGPADPSGHAGHAENGASDQPDSEPILPLQTRRTIRDKRPAFADSWGESVPKVSAEFGERPPPPQAVAVRALSNPPIPREEPSQPLTAGSIEEALSLDLTPGPVPVEPAQVSAPSVDVGEIDPEEETRLLEDIEGMDSGPHLVQQGIDRDAPTVPGTRGVNVSSLLIPEPPRSQAVAVPPHKPPTPVGQREPLPSVIVDVSPDFLTLVDRLARDPADELAEAELLRQGHRAMPSIMARFPGPISKSWAEIDETRPKIGECGPILRLIAGQRRVALPFVLARVEDPEPDLRFWATFLLTELAYPEAVPAIVARLFDSEERIRRAAQQAARVAAESARDPLVDELRRIVSDPGATERKRIATLEALGEMRDGIVVPILIGELTDSRDAVATAARRALALVSRQDFGKDARRWVAWWSQNQSRHRIEWLIDALTDEHEGTRKDAFAELKALTHEYFGYYDNLARRDRERAQQRYRDWWRSEGRGRFRRD